MNVFKRLLLRVLNIIQTRFHLVFVRFTTRERRKVLRLVEQIRRETETLQNQVEAYQLYMCTKQAMKLPGEVAEVGAYKGGTAKLMCEAKGDRPMHVFDPFEQIAESFVHALLKPYPNVHIYKGYFPGTAGPIENKQFVIVHMDVNNFEPTLATLKFFYPRLVKGGIILCHDYTHAEYAGVKKAIREFFADKPELVLETTGSHCMIVKG